jgi:hypothetical protein
MSTSDSKLRLGPLPRHETVKLTISVPVALKDELDLYAAEFSQLHEPVDAVVLIPHMLEAFIRSDRGYRARRTSAKNARQKVAAGVEHLPHQNHSG